MAADHPGDPWPGATYHGFSGGEAPAAPRRPKDRRPAAMLVAGLAAAVLMGAVVGLAARPRLAVRGEAPRPAAPAAEPVRPGASASEAAALADAPVPAQAADQGSAALDVQAPPQAADLPIKVKPAPKPAPVHSNGRLQVLAPRLVHAAAPASKPARRAAPPAAPDGAGPFFAPAAPADGGAAPAEIAATQPPAQPAAHASFDCATARVGAEQMICSNPGLAAQDRAMARAYRRALSASASPDDMRSEQRDFMAMREDAARRSPRALAGLYDQRIHDLNDVADGDDSSDGDDAPDQ